MSYQLPPAITAYLDSLTPEGEARVLTTKLWRVGKWYQIKGPCRCLVGAAEGLNSMEDLDCMRLDDVAEYASEAFEQDMTTPLEVVTAAIRDYITARQARRALTAPAADNTMAQFAASADARLREKFRVGNGSDGV